MALILAVAEDLKAALKSGDTFQRDALRFLSSALKNEAIDLRKPLTDLTDEETEAVIRRSVKQRRDSITSYRTGGREDLAVKEEAELHLLEKYLPAELSAEEVEKIVAAVIAEAGPFTGKDMGKVMGLVMKKIANRASGDAVKTVVARLLPE
jgi:uncharacterized protein YqeY